MSEPTLQVLAVGERDGLLGIQLAGRHADLVRGKRITQHGLYDELTRTTKKGPVTVPDCRYYQRLISQGVLREAKAAEAEPEKASRRGKEG